MPSARGKKIAIAGAILIVGIGTALAFRRDEPSPAPAAARSPAEAAARPGGKAAAQPSSSEQPQLAGRIEPYTGWGDEPNKPQEPAATAAQTAPAQPGSLATTATPTAGTAQGADRGTAADKPTAESPVSTGAGRFPGEYAPADSTASSSSIYASEGPAVHTAGSPLKWQIVPRPGSADSDRTAQKQHTAPERFEDDRAVSTPPLRSTAPDKRHRIIDGDTLAGIAQRYLGSAERRLDVFEYNRDVLATPELLPIGKELRIPPPSFVPPSAAPIAPQPSGLSTVAQVVARPQIAGDPFRGISAGPAPSAALPPLQTYVVQPHDTLPLIARKLYGSIDRQAELITANRQQLRSAKDLRPGMTLFVPAKNGGR